MAGELQRPGGLIRVGETGAEVVLLRLGTKRVCG